MESIKTYKNFISEGNRSGNLTDEEVYKVASSNKKWYSLDDFEKELNLGIKVEGEHTDDISVARRIALDHLVEDPDYYAKLDKAGLIDEPGSKF